MKATTILAVVGIGFAVGVIKTYRTIRKQNDEYHLRRLKYEALVRKVGRDKAYEMLKRGWDIVDGNAV